MSNRAQRLDRYAFYLEAETARLREALTEIMGWIKNWDPNFIYDGEWPAARDRALAAISPPSASEQTCPNPNDPKFTGPHDEAAKEQR